MNLSFEKKPLLLGLAGGAFINAAIVGMNTLPTKMGQQMVGMPLFTIGWALVIMGFLNNDTRAHKYRNILAISSLGVYTMAMTARMLADAGKNGLPIKLAKGKFLLCWIAIGVLIGMKQHDETEEGEKHDPTIHALGLLPPALVVISMMSINGLERPKNIASGPGMPLFASAWVILSLVNSLNCKSARQKAIDSAVN